MIGVLINAIIPESAFVIFSSIYTSVLIIIWIVILVSHLNFIKIKIINGEDKKLEYKSLFYPYANYVSIIFLVMVIIIMAIESFSRFAGITIFMIILWVTYIIMNRVKKNSYNKIMEESEAYEES